MPAGAGVIVLKPRDEASGGLVSDRKSLSHPKRVKSAARVRARADDEIELSWRNAVRFQARQFALRQICGACVAAQ
jgi:hypothetical protein